jgi:transposase-like protein
VRKTIYVIIHDRTTDGRPLKWLSIVDEYTRECLALEVERGITSGRVIDVLTELFRIRGVPKHIRSDNGPEFIAQAIRRWLGLAGVETLAYMAFPREHWMKIRTNNMLERIMREIRRRTRVVGNFPDGRSALMLVAARLRHIAGTKWGTKRYLDMERLREQEVEELTAQTA